MVIEIYHISYYVEINKREYVFFLEKKQGDIVYFKVSDVGGQADMIPKFSEQLEWTEEYLKNFKEMKQVWPTVWEVFMKDPIKEIEDFLSKEAKILKKNRIDY